jgi:hypothetical protein
MIGRGDGMIRIFTRKYLGNDIEVREIDTDSGRLLSYRVIDQNLYAMGWDSLEQYIKKRVATASKWEEKKDGRPSFLWER